MRLRLLVRRAAARLGILPIVFAAYRWVHESTPKQLLADARVRRAERLNGPPIPPARLLYSISTTPSATHFLESGSAAATAIREALARADRPWSAMTDILDFGCGCGRVLRQWSHDPALRLHGCDYNPAGIAWVNKHLPWVETRVNGLEPPLPYASGSFDFVYALSVYTHLPTRLQDAWTRELHRVLRPGGVLLISTLGAAYLDRLDPDERRQFAAGECVVRDERLAGTNLCAAYHPPAAVEAQFGVGFRILEHAPEGARGNGLQDQYLLERLV